MSNKCKHYPGALVSFLAMMIVSLWIFGVNLPARENDKKEKSKREIPGKINNVSKSREDKDRRLEAMKKMFQNRMKRPDQIKRMPEITERRQKRPGQIKRMPEITERKQERPGEMEKAPENEEIKKPAELEKFPGPGESPKKIPDKIKKSPGDKKEKKKIPDEIIAISKLNQVAKEFSINRDIFSPEPMRPVGPGNRTQEYIPPKPPPEVKKDLPQQDVTIDAQTEIQGLSYEGYVIKESKNCALVSMNGEFYAVTVGDSILEKIKIIKIGKKAITVEVDSHELKIDIKEEEENEIQ